MGVKVKKINSGGHTIIGQNQCVTITEEERVAQLAHLVHRQEEIIKLQKNTINSLTRWLKIQSRQ